MGVSQCYPRPYDERDSVQEDLLNQRQKSNPHGWSSECRPDQPTEKPPLYPTRLGRSTGKTLLYPTRLDQPIGRHLLCLTRLEQQTGRPLLRRTRQGMTPGRQPHRATPNRWGRRQPEPRGPNGYPRMRVPYPNRARGRKAIKSWAEVAPVQKTWRPLKRQ